MIRVLVRCANPSHPDKRPKVSIGEFTKYEPGLWVLANKFGAHTDHLQDDQPVDMLARALAAGPSYPEDGSLAPERAKYRMQCGVCHRNFLRRADKFGPVLSQHAAETEEPLDLW